MMSNFCHLIVDAQHINFLLWTVNMLFRAENFCWKGSSGILFKLNTEMIDRLRQHLTPRSETPC